MNTACFLGYHGQQEWPKIEGERQNKYNEILYNPSKWTWIREHDSFCSIKFDLEK